MGAENISENNAILKKDQQNQKLALWTDKLLGRQIMRKEI